MRRMHLMVKGAVLALVVALAVHLLLHKVIGRAVNRKALHRWSSAFSSVSHVGHASYPCLHSIATAPVPACEARAAIHCESSEHFPARAWLFPRRYSFAAIAQSFEARAGSFAQSESAAES